MRYAQPRKSEPHSEAGPAFWKRSGVLIPILVVVSFWITLVIVRSAHRDAHAQTSALIDEGPPQEEQDTLEEISAITSSSDPPRTLTTRAANGEVPVARGPDGKQLPPGWGSTNSDAYAAELDVPSKAGPTLDPKLVLSDKTYREWSDRTPRFHLGICTADLKARCPYDRTILTGQIDPMWSHATERRLRTLWEENVSSLSTEFLFVKCSASACQVNYRFPLTIVGTMADDERKVFYAFIQGFRKSTLTLEMRMTGIFYAGPVFGANFVRIRAQDDR